MNLGYKALHQILQYWESALLEAGISREMRILSDSFYFLDSIVLCLPVMWRIRQYAGLQMVI